MAKLISLLTRYPRAYRQGDIANSFIRACQGYTSDFAYTTKVRSIFNNTMINTRHCFNPPDNCITTVKMASTDIEANHYRAQRAMTNLLLATTKESLDQAGLLPQQIDHVISTSELSTLPPIDADIAGTLGMTEVSREPLISFGCAAGVAGLSAALRYLENLPQAAVLYSAAECPSRFFSTVLPIRLTRLLNDPEEIPHKAIINEFVVAALLGDAVASSVLVGRKHPLYDKRSGPVFTRAASRLYPMARGLVGQVPCEAGSRMWLDPGIPDFAAKVLPTFLQDFLGPEVVKHKIIHAGGRRVLETLEKELNLSPLTQAWATMRDGGNTISVTILNTLERTLNSASERDIEVENDSSGYLSPLSTYEPGDTGVMIAVGPGFTANLIRFE